MRGVFVLPVDVPAPGAGVFENLAGALGGDPHAVAAIPTFRREHGHPVYVSWAFARECTLHVDGVAEARLDRLIGERRVEVEVEDEGVVVNLNTTADFETWARRHGGGGAAGEQR
jgi:CTP:molybdopterin cytidylyltransferase MocA